MSNVVNTIGKFSRLLGLHSVLLKAYSFGFEKYCKWLYNQSPRKSAEFYIKHFTGKMPDLDNPKNLEEINIWLALNTDTTIWSKCSDKYAVREYIEEKGEGVLLNELYGKWDSADDIDFSLLPDKFVIKTNNGCATVLIVTDKSKINIPQTRQLLNKWLKKEYGYFGYNGHYLRIKPCLICEKYLKDEKSGETPIDYKFYCTYGTPIIIEVITERNIEKRQCKATLYDTNWEVIHESTKESKEIVEKPESFDKMISACKTLAQNFPFVRVDFYEIQGKPIFGELTFTPEIRNFSPSISEKLAKNINVEELKRRYRK